VVAAGDNVFNIPKRAFNFVENQVIVAQLSQQSVNIFLSVSSTVSATDRFLFFPSVALEKAWDEA